MNQEEISPEQAMKYYSSLKTGTLDTQGLGNQFDFSQAQELYKQIKYLGLKPTASSSSASSSGSVFTNFGEQLSPSELPIDGRVTQGYGAPVNYEKSGKHGGIDIGVPEGTVIPDKKGGTVLSVENSKGGYGNSVIVLGNDGIVRRYSHLSKIGVSIGDILKPGTPVGLSGNTGYSTGPHLDYREYKSKETR